jgi:soluble lytic murein transglycosylase
VQSRLEERPAVERARELYFCERTDLASVELRYGLRLDPPETRIQAARLVEGWGWATPAVQLLSEMQQWDDLWLRFPMPWEEQVEDAAKAAGLPGEWIYAVLRTESLYDPRAVSTAGALGLLQLRLPTARLVARRAGVPRPSHDDLFVPAVNLALGAQYLRELHDRFGRNLPLALAAYNAGPLRVPYWLPRAPVDADIWIENIPYNETRTYVQRALSALVITGWRRDGAPRALLPLLHPVARLSQDAQP